MRWQVFSFSVIFLVAAFILSQKSPRVEAQGDGYPAHVSGVMNAILVEAHKTFRRDAIITNVEVQGGSGLYWLMVSLYSPSNGALLTVYAGGPQNGQFSVGAWKPQDSSQVALPTNFNIDLPDALATLRKAGLKGPLGVTRLVWAGASDTPPVLAWSIRIAGGPIMFPLFVDAHDGKVISWHRAMDPPNASDEQLRAAWDAFAHRDRSPHEKDPRECVVEIQETGNCAP